MPTEPSLERVAIDVVVAWSPAPREVTEWLLQLHHGATVRDAIRASGFGAAQPVLDLEQANAAVWGRKAEMADLLEDKDRVEVLRPLKADPKVARRERFSKQGSRAAGLFANKRTGAKSGY